MSVPLYVPVLPTRPHAAATYRALAPDLQRQVAPLWTLPPRPGMLPKPLAERIAKEAGDISTAQRLGSGWLDAPFADEDEAAVLADVLTPGWWDHRNMRPVTGPGRPGAQQLLALAAARHREDGLGVRVRLPDDWNDLGRRRASRPDAHRPPRRPVPRPRHRPARPPRRCQGGCASPGHPDPAHVLAHGDRHGRRLPRTARRLPGGRPVRGPAYGLGDLARDPPQRTHVPAPTALRRLRDPIPPRTSPRPHRRAAEARRGASSATPPPAPTTCPKCRTASSTTTPTGRLPGASPVSWNFGARRRVRGRGGCGTGPGVP